MVESNDPPSCCTCDRYVDCAERIKKMRAIKLHFGTSSRTDIRIRLLAMQSIAEKCTERTKEEKEWQE